MRIRLNATNEIGQSQRGSVATLIKALQKWQQTDKKFNFELEVLPTGTRSRLAVQISITKVRLKARRPYCGNHAGPCQIQGAHTNRSATYLEGGDWVRFNDKLNDILDRVAGGLCASVASAACVIRQGAERRTRYEMSVMGHGDWQKTGEELYYEDHRGRRAPRSLAEAGTPGLPVSQYL